MLNGGDLRCALLLSTAANGPRGPNHRQNWHASCAQGGGDGGPRRDDVRLDAVVGRRPDASEVRQALEAVCSMAMLRYHRMTPLKGLHMTGLCSTRPWHTQLIVFS